MKKYFLITLLFISSISSIFSQSDSTYFFHPDEKQELTDFFSDNNIEPFSISFVGSGNIQKSISNSEAIPVNTGIGVNIEKYIVNRDKVTELYESKPFLNIYKMNLEAVVNVASTADTLIGQLDDDFNISNQSEFGSSILTPLNSGQAFNFDVYGYFYRPLLRIINGIDLHYVGSNRVWSFSDSLGKEFNNKTTINKFKIGVFHEIVPLNERKSYSVTLGAAIVRNSISGDISFDDKENFRKFVIGTNKRVFYGWEVNSQIRLKNIRASFAYTVFRQGDNIDGFSGGQLVTTISFVGGFGLKLDD